MSGESDEEVRLLGLEPWVPLNISAFLTAYMIAGDAARRPCLLRAPHLTPWCWA